ncbi:MAG: acyclic terpene utilization AtuA family protein [Planctomycetota bacterium]|jgi:hypothetical protein
MPDEIKFLSICGLLGYGYPLESLKKGVEAGAAFLGVDAGSTDPGPYYLGSGTGFVKPIQVRRDIEPALLAARKHDIPLVVGTAGGSGAKPHVDYFLSILMDIAKEHHLHFKLAVIYADIDKQTVLRACNEKKITPCNHTNELTEEKVTASSHIVGQMGTAPFIEALATGTDVIIAGRACDTAIFAAMPIMQGFDHGLAWHCAKIAECGALCAKPAGANDSLLAIIRPDHFIVEPTNTIRRCTPGSVAAHSLYEQPDPSCFFEPEGKVDMSGSQFDSYGDRGVRVSGTKLIPASKNTVKLEAAQLKGYRAITIAGISDPAAIAHLDEIKAKVKEATAGNLKGIMEPDDYSLRFYGYGVDGVTEHNGKEHTPLPAEVGLLIEAIGPTQQLADTVLSLARSTTLHQSFTGRKTTAGNLAFPFSPSDFQGGPVYEFSIYHLMEIEKDQKLFQVIYEQV